MYSLLTERLFQGKATEIKECNDWIMYELIFNIYFLKIKRKWKVFLYMEKYLSGCLTKLFCACMCIYIYPLLFESNIL